MKIQKMNFLRDNPGQKFVFYDFETCSLNCLRENAPWSLGYILYQNGKILESHNHYIKWDNLNISKDAARITRFDMEEYKRKAEDPIKVLDKFESYLLNDQYINAGHNLMNFDIYVLKIWREKLGRKNDYSYLDRTIDTNSIARAIKKGVKQIKPEERKMMMFRFGNYVEKGLKTNLTALGKELKIDVNYENLHESQNDVILTAKVWDKLKYLIEI